ncbi:MAG: pyrroline-5-carboxylate reductase [Flavobacteriales bacterium]
MKVAIFGCGNIGKIYLKTILKSGLALPKNITIIEKNNTQKPALEAQYLGTNILEFWTQQAVDILLIAVKPQDFPAVKPVLNNAIDPQTLVISVMAGITLQNIAESLNHTKTVRAMPNAPVEFGFGMTAYCSSDEVEVSDIRNAEKLFSSTGRTLYLEDEKLMDAVTALSGSGPAYFFYIVKAMIQAGKELGFSDSAAATLVKQTMLGAFHQLNASTQNLDELITTVASRGGTTEAALEVFEKGKLNTLIQDAIYRAKERGAGLAKES